MPTKYDLEKQIESLNRDVDNLQKEVCKLKEELSAALLATTWQPMETVPLTGPFFVANFAPTSWVYHPSFIIDRPYLEPEVNQKMIKTQCRWSRAWMRAPLPPGPFGTGW